VFNRMDRAAGVRQPWRPGEVAIVALAGVIAAYVALVNLSPWPPLLTVRHLLASGSCQSAWAVGLTPSVEGEPGYWRRLDFEPDGRSCELWTEERRGAGLCPFDGSYRHGRCPDRQFREGRG
jgi:hypothetical protein